jgi:arylsulfatase A-like enzyme
VSDDARRFASLGAAVRADAGRAVVLAAAGCAAVAVVELVATWLAYPASPTLGAGLRLAALAATLLALLWLVLAPLAVVAIAGPRIARAWFGDGDATAGGGWLSWGPRRDAAPRGVAAVWAAVVIGGAALVAMQRFAYFAVTHFKEQQLIALTIAAAALAMAPLGYGALRIVHRGFALGGDLLYPTTGRWSPLTSWPGALLGLTALIGGVLAAALVALPQLRPLVPWRIMLDGAAFGAGAAAAAWWIHGHRLPRARRRRFGQLAALVALVLVPTSLLSLGAEHETRSIAVSSSPLLSRLIDGVRRANDFDRDGFGSLLGENDCGPFDGAIKPGVRDVPDNGIDENCDGRDFSLRELVAPKPGEKVAVPAPFRRDWNVLLLTVDTVRYDHTTFGGYAQGPKKRNTTPNLDKLVKKSTSFNFANAPSAGTMASVPAILTSKFFHSGVALEVKGTIRGMPPRMRPENTLLAEIMKRKGYKTGAILSHEYFNDWGMDQGVDDYDNSIGKTGDPFRVSSHLSTDRALAWVSRHVHDKWFLWVHYLDPHGRYVAHPDDVDYGSSEEDLYDAELFYTDKHIGRLLDELARLPGGDRTIVVITSDHGDAFGEHGFINHGQALYKELLHVPLIVYVPDNEPREVGGAVSPLDIVPTVAALTGIDVSDLQFEGESLVPQIFFGKEDHDRVVFAETNWPKPLRAAVSSRYKLVYNLQNNLDELYDLHADPWEKTNIAARDRAATARMKEPLDRWLERVVYSRDATYNQAAEKMAEVLLTAPPTPAAPATGVSFDGGRLAVLGATPKTARVKPGDKLEIEVFLEVKDRPSGAFKPQIIAWPVTAAGFAPKAAIPAQISKGTPRLTLDGLFPSDRWRPGELIRERLSVSVPRDWAAVPADAVAYALVMVGAPGTRLEPTGAVPANDKAAAVLGTVALDKPAPPPLPAPPTPAAPSPR